MMLPEKYSCWSKTERQSVHAIYIFNDYSEKKMLQVVLAAYLIWIF